MIERFTGPSYVASLRQRVEQIDIDDFQIVYFSRYGTFMEKPALMVFEQNGFGLKRLKAMGLELRVRELLIKYKAPAHYGDELLLQAGVLHIGPAHIRMAVQVCLANKEKISTVLAKGELDFVFVETKSGRPAIVPGDLATFLKEII